MKVSIVGENNITHSVRCVSKYDAEKLVLDIITGVQERFKRLDLDGNYVQIFLENFGLRRDHSAP